MERDGWLERTACSDDRRKKRIRATPKAEAVWNRMVACCHRVRARATEGISTEELQNFKHLCERIRANLGPNEEPPIESAPVTEPCAVGAGA
jgi:DNA-binding MarR family transcriptional regulator